MNKLTSLAAFFILSIPYLIHSQDLVKDYEMPPVIKGSNLTLNANPHFSGYYNPGKSQNNFYFNAGINYSKWMLTKKLNYSFYSHLYTNASSRNNSVSESIIKTNSADEYNNSLELS